MAAKQASGRSSMNVERASGGKKREKRKKRERRGGGRRLSSLVFNSIPTSAKGGEGEKKRGRKEKGVEQRMGL